MDRCARLQRPWLGLAGLALAGALAGCLTWSIKRDPFYDAFFEKTSLIMTEEEIAIYLGLPDTDSKRRFIQEFWELRDPDPSTEENENRMEFARRIEFANRWFDVAGGCFGQEVPRGRKYRPWGWDTDRGRVYLVMGTPDEICYFGGGPVTWQSFDSDDGAVLCRAAAWRYLRYRTSFIFAESALAFFDPYDVSEEGQTTAIRAPRRSSFSSISSNTEAMNRAKLDMVGPAGAGVLDPRFRIKVDWRDGGLRVRVPIKTVSFEDRDGRLAIRFESRVIVYRGGRKVDDLTREDSFSLAEDEALRMKSLEFLIPYPAPRAGRYLFDVIVGYPGAAGVRKTREYLKRTF